MAPKMLDCRPSSAKKTRKTAGVCKTPPAASTTHPTLMWMTEVLEALEDEFKVLEGASAHDFGGISAFCPDKYKLAMTDNGEYECNLTVVQHSVMKLEHADTWPVIGAVQRLQAAVFTTENGEPAAVFPHTIAVRAVSAVDAPQRCERLHRSAYFFAFLASWAEAKKGGQEDIAAKFFATAFRVRTKFLLLPNDDAANRKKWTLAEETDSMQDNGASLVGYKKTCGVVAIQRDLRERGCAADAAAVAAWFSKIKWNNPTDALPLKDVYKHLRIYARMMAMPVIKERLDLAESLFGRRHTLAGVSTLDLLCIKTSVTDNDNLSAALLHWVVEGAVVLMLRKNIKSDIGRDTLVGKIVPKMMLVRRLALWLLKRFKYKSVPGVTYVAGYEPENVGTTLFASWAAFHKAYPLGPLLEQRAKDMTAQTSGSATFLTKLSESQFAVLEFVASLFNCTGDIDQIMSHALSKDGEVSAESFFEKRVELVKDDIFDLTEMTEKHARETKTPEPAACDDVAPERQEVEAVPEDQPAQLTPAEQQPHLPLLDKNSQLHFPELCFSEAARARLDSVEPERFTQMVRHAERRLDPWVDIKIFPSDNAPEVIKGAHAIKQMEPTDKLMHVWCAGTGSESVHPSRHQRPYKYTAGVDKKGLEALIEQIFSLPPAGISDAPENSVKPKTFFATHPSVFILSDGRRASTTKTVMGLVNKAAKRDGAERINVFPFRLMHSNAEFSHARRSRGAGFSMVPEPLETLTIVMGASFKVKTIARKFLDCPGDNRCRGLNNVPLKPLVVGVTWERRCEILHGSAKTAVEDEDVLEGTEDNDKMDEVEEKTGDEKDEDQDTNEDRFKNLICDLYPWEHHEKVCRELLNCFDVKMVVHYNTNVSWPLACARHSRHFLGFARNEAHAQHIRKTLVANVVAEIIEGTHDGFAAKRFLSQQRSLGGSTEEGGAAPEAKRRRTRGQDGDKDEGGAEPESVRAASSQGEDGAKTEEVVSSKGDKPAAGSDSSSSEDS